MEGSRDGFLIVFYSGLFLAWAALLFGGFIFGTPDTDNTRRMPRWTRLASSFVLVIAAWSIAFFSDEDGMSFRGWIAVGMTLGFVGDLFMAGVFPLKQYVIGGIAAFGLGHIAYIGAFLGIVSSVSAPPFIFMWMIAAVLWWFVVYQPALRQQTVSIIHFIALPYALLLATTAGAAINAAQLLDEWQALLPVIGALLFLVSDLILAAELFSGAKFKWINDVVWLTYGPAQMLIVYGSALMVVGWRAG
jgi:uncharacterized membrane protein YhhN